MSVSESRLVISVGARSDLRDIRRYTVRRWNVRQYTSYRATLMTAVEKLTRFPHLGTAPPNVASGLRALTVDQHVVYYLVSTQTITIVRILHSRIDASALLGP